MTRLLFANNYDMALARAGWRNGTYPAHHLYGTAELGAPFDVVDIRDIRGDLLDQAGRRLRGRAGNLGLQLRSLAGVRRDTIIYTAQASEFPGLGALRAHGLLRAPLVGTFHAGGLPGLLAATALRGFDHAIALSEQTRSHLEAAGMPADRITVASWGPDLDFGPFRAATAAAEGAPLVSTGKSGRDLETLLRAVGATGARAHVYGDPSALAELVREAPSATIVPSVAPPAPPNTPYDYGHTIADLQSAAVVAIPLAQRYPLHGLTELADAIGCGKPVIVTRAPYFDIDVEAVGCGWWVDPGDVAGWAHTISEAFSDRERLAEMGERGRRWAAERWNARRFAATVRAALEGQRAHGRS